MVKSINAEVIFLKLILRIFEAAEHECTVEKKLKFKLVNPINLQNVR